jgi:hypothetical protein
MILQLNATGGDRSSPYNHPLEPKPLKRKPEKRKPEKRKPEKRKRGALPKASRNKRNVRTD